ncbi:NTP transferase domain-containing protein [Peptostreptococcus russellii]|uniref:sugar phosphate nucleotidyltransferase n=1 Tax=Peptostreptococcus russellii TaxID=215200 RepID=UPI001626B0BE|nr:sugar phosphate nucleotidyltransferase [Peptostreptococcus russellii]MBC2578396.1 NTP transferase domain-containing protein [Peptostreptococcus russellii]
MKAIILAAGLGTRLRPITNTTPKSLVKVMDEAMAERQVRFLKEKGIEDITIVTGYLAEKFDYLKEKYGVKLVFNDKYDKYNNIYTMYLVKDILPDSYVIEGDIYMNNNIFRSDIKETSYFSCYKENFSNEWELKYNSSDRVEDIVVGDGNGYIMCGISYWSKKEGEFIKSKLEKISDINDYKNFYWDNVVKDNISNLNIKIEKLNQNDLFEIDSIEDLEATEKKLLVK